MPCVCVCVCPGARFRVGGCAGKWQAERQGKRGRRYIQGQGLLENAGLFAVCCGEDVYMQLLLYEYHQTIVNGEVRPWRF